MAPNEPAEPVETSIGARFERAEIRMYHGRKYFIGDSVTSQGERLFRTVACEKMVHSPTVMFAEMVWEHIGKFARDTKTGELIQKSSWATRPPGGASSARRTPSNTGA